MAHLTLNHIEVAIRAFDPRLPCATHALGKMPLEVELLDVEGGRVDLLARPGAGDFAEKHDSGFTHFTELI